MSTSPATSTAARIGAVCIGRNEGARIQRCVQAARPQVALVVYADSGSSDDSIEQARAVGAETIRCSDDRPHSAARARNTGFAHLDAASQDLDFVQFIDGDTALDPDWCAAAVAAFDADPNLTVVCGHLRERDRETSIYRRLCDMDWQGPVGEIPATGGNAMIRYQAFADSGGYDEKLIAGEEAELCARLRTSGGTLRRIDAALGVHDSGISTFGGWWYRARRSGQWDAVRAFRKDFARRREFRRLAISHLFWGGFVPLLMLLALIFLPRMWSLGFVGLCLLGYLIIGWRAARYMRSRGRSSGDAALFGTFCVLGKLPEFLGQCAFAWTWLTNRSSLQKADS